MNDAASPLRISRSSAGLVLSGEIDGSTAPMLSTALTGLLNEFGDVSVEMNDVVFIDSSGLRALIEAHQSAERSQKRLTIMNPSSVVSRLFELSGLSREFNVSQRT